MTSTIINPLEANNLLFYGTSINRGEADGAHAIAPSPIGGRRIGWDGHLLFIFCARVRAGIVIRCGDNTVLGQIAKTVSQEKVRTSPMTREIHTLVIRIGIVALIVAIIFFIIGVVQGSGGRHEMT